MGDIVKLTPLQMDALKEAVNIGAGNAANALSKLAASKVSMSVPKASIVPLEHIPKIVCHDDKGELLIRIGILGEAPGTILISIPMESACLLSDILMERKAGDTEQLSQMDLSALLEVGNILSGNYLSALETFIGVPFRSSVPFMAVDKEGKVLDGALSELSKQADYAVVIESELKEKEHSISAQFFLLPNPSSLEKIMGVLGVD